MTICLTAIADSGGQNLTYRIIGGKTSGPLPRATRFGIAHRAASGCGSRSPNDTGAAVLARRDEAVNNACQLGSALGEGLIVVSSVIGDVEAVVVQLCSIAVGGRAGPQSKGKRSEYARDRHKTQPAGSQPSSSLERSSLETVHQSSPLFAFGNLQSILG
ncbi:hypothetical protein GQ43DRAFT_432662 [Delitschia confertaspora ATCC 74209]|uniref:Uncharacterized protein n=1 Tax=Delitschia confertaspora ATCC 74209 TaxID=1513339 RepID=A0A9P4JIZ6_9PLEO|nr:hypothetical protein GQ43DRAFT_432662 [Delitschia confertaspora ATCC 74209]